MQWINMSEEILDMLNPYAEWFFKQDLNWLETKSKENEKNTNTLEYSCSEEYLKEIVDKDGQHIGYPEISYSFDLQSGGIPGEFQEKYNELVNNLLMFLGASNQAVHVYYPKNGFMGWHNNWNSHGYNILLSYTKNGGGFFKYRDPITHEVVEMLDPGGWSGKVGYYGRGREPDKVYYHCAGSYEPRLTLGFVIPNIDIWRSMIEDISGEDSSHFS